MHADATPPYDLVVVGHGAAGLAAALAAREAVPDARIVVLEAAPAERAGGNTRWSPSYMRMEAVPIRATCSASPTRRCRRSRGCSASASLSIGRRITS